MIVTVHTAMHCCMIFFLQLLSIIGASKNGITGGRPVKPNSRPYMVSLQVGGHHVCGGILIRKDFVLTSAHCKHNAMIAVLGAHDITKIEKKTQQRIPVAKYYPHPEYDDHRFDIMLLKLKTNAVLNKYVKLVALPKKDGKIPANIKCSVAGWGMTAPNTISSDILREVTIKMQFSFECRNKWQQYFSYDQMLCTRSDGRKGICQGDSGGPLICNTKALGLAAFTNAKECDNPKFPHVYMKIPFFLPWIDNTMKGYSQPMMDLPMDISVHNVY